MMPEEMQQAIAETIAYLDRAACHAAVLNLCLESLRESEVDLPTQVAWILENLIEDMECLIPESLYHLRRVELGLTQFEDTYLSFPPTC